MRKQGLRGRRHVTWPWTTQQLDNCNRASAMRVQQLLETRAFACVMVGAGHLDSRVVYTKKLLYFYSKKSSEIFRPPSVMEAESADQIDLPCSSVVMDRDLLRHVLVEKPRLPKVAPKQKGDHKGEARLRSKRELEHHSMLRGWVGGDSVHWFIEHGVGWVGWVVIAFFELAHMLDAMSV